MQPVMTPPQQEIKTAVRIAVRGQVVRVEDESGRCLAIMPNGPHEKSDAVTIVAALNNYASIEQENQRLKEQVNTWATRAEAYKQAAEFSELGAKRAEQENQKLREALQQFAECNLNDDNCASLEVASQRISRLAQQALSKGQNEN